MWRALASGAAPQCFEALSSARLRYQSCTVVAEGAHYNPHGCLFLTALTTGYFLFFPIQHFTQHRSCILAGYFIHSSMATWFCHSTHIWLPANLSVNLKPEVAGKGADSTWRIAFRPTQCAVPSDVAVWCPEVPSSTYQGALVSLSPSSFGDGGRSSSRCSAP
jgi:hypothetical protein